MTNKGSSDRTKLITKVGSCQVSWLWWLQNMLPKFFDVPTMDRASRSLSLNLGPVMNWLPEQWQKWVMLQFPSTGLDLLSLGTGILGLTLWGSLRSLWRGPCGEEWGPWLLVLAELPANSNVNSPTGFPGGSAVKNPPANAGDMGLSPDLGRSHMAQSI